MATFFCSSDTYLEYSIWTGEVWEFKWRGEDHTGDDRALADFAESLGLDVPNSQGLYHAWVLRLFEIGVLKDPVPS
jgi:hypothetical protein